MPEVLDRCKAFCPTVRQKKNSFYGIGHLVVHQGGQVLEDRVDVDDVGLELPDGAFSLPELFHVLFLLEQQLRLVLPADAFLDVDLNKRKTVPDCNPY
jgi:hypothetical protein